MSIDWLSPSALMTGNERGQARRLLRKLERHHEHVRVDESLPARERRGYEHFRAKREAIDGEIDALSTQVLERELGLERYMVIDVRRPDRERVRFQLLTMGFQSSGGRLSRWMWVLSGRRLRKDQTIGEVDEYAYVDIGSIWRRCLNGTWVQLRPLSSQE